MDLIGSLFTLLALLFCVVVWMLPILFIAGSDRTEGKEKVAWILAVIFVSWFAWVFYLLLAPLKRQERYGYYRWGLVFGGTADVKISVEGDDGNIVHAELVLPAGLLMVGPADGAAPERWGVLRASPMDLGWTNTQTLQLYVDNVDEHCAKARAAGARIVDEPEVHLSAQ